jgi:hypothetical protein
LGGLSGGDSESRMWLRSIGVGTVASTSELSGASAEGSLFRSFETAINRGATECLQQECEAGMAEFSHMVAIFMQQLCSSTVMGGREVMQAERGCPRSNSIRALATILKRLFNMLILQHPCKRAGFRARPPLPNGKGGHCEGFHCCLCSAAFAMSS